MEILNKKERVSAFLLFLLMLVITVGVLVFAVFFNYKLPWKENEALKQENDRIMTEFRYQEQFSREIHELTSSIDSLDRAGDGFQFLEQNINLRLARLNDGIPSDKEVFKNTLLYNNVVLNLKDLVTAKRKLQLLKQSDEKINELKEQVKEYDEAVKELRRQLEISRQLSNR